MPLNFIRTTVAPGEPVTAQAWNDIVDGLVETQAAVLSAGGRTVRVAVAGDPRDIAAARVIAAGANGTRFAAAPPSSQFDPFVFSHLTPSSYIIRVMAPGCTDDGVTGITLAEDGTVAAANGTVLTGSVPLTLTPNRPRMPNVLGVPWKNAVGQLGSPVNAHALDASGKGVPLTAFDAAYANVPVLMQWPGPEEIVPAGKDPYVILAMRPPVLVTTPNFVGMTLAEAQTEAAKLGLVIKIV